MKKTLPKRFDQVDSARHVRTEVHIIRIVFDKCIRLMIKKLQVGSRYNTACWIHAIELKTEAM